MPSVAAFFGGLVLANGIPHFIHGISGREFHAPFFHRFFRRVPSPLFNVLWGLLNFALAYVLSRAVGGVPAAMGLLAFWIGFAFAAVGLSVYFRDRSRREGAG